MFTPGLLDDADSTHAEAAREMFVSGDYVTLHVNGVRYLEKAPLPYWLVALSYHIFGVNEFATRLPMGASGPGGSGGPFPGGNAGSPARPETPKSSSTRS